MLNRFSESISVMKTQKTKSNTVYLIASGDLRLSANQQCWPEQEIMEKKLSVAAKKLGYQIKRAHPVDKKQGHGFVSSQRMGMDVFKNIPENAPVIVAESVWQYSHHVLAGLYAHKGKILLVANWSGTWPGLVGMMNLAASLTKAKVKYSSLWSENFDDEFFTANFKNWLAGKDIVHPTPHVKPYKALAAKIPAAIKTLGKTLAEKILKEKLIMGVFDEGCMGMHNAIIPEELLMPIGVYKERLSQSALYYKMTTISDKQAKEVYDWLVAKGMKFAYGKDVKKDLTKDQVLEQCKMYVAAAQIGDEFGCDSIGIQYQQGLKDLCSASDLVEGILNNADRPPVKNAAGKLIKAGKPFTHFNEVDECAGLDGMFTELVHSALKQPSENTLHDLRWGDYDKSGSTKDYLWVLLISGGAPAAHHIGGYKGTTGYRQPAMFFPKGGATCSGVAKKGDIVWSRIFIEDGKLKMDIGVGNVPTLPESEVQRRLKTTTEVWPIMNAALKGIDRDLMMAKHKGNHIQIAYAKSAKDAQNCMYAKASLANALGLEVNFCGV